MGALYTLFFLLYIVPFENTGGDFYFENMIQTPAYFALLAGSILIFLKRKSGIFVSLAGIFYIIGNSWYSLMQPPFNRLATIDLGVYLTDVTDPFGIPSLAIGTMLLVIGWKKVRWNSIEKPENYNSGVLRAARIFLFTALPIVIVILLYFVFLSEIRTALRAIAGT
jgi:hypothetical protein